MLRCLARPSALVALALCLSPGQARAYISQVDGTVVPQTGNMQACLDRPVTGEAVAGSVDAVRDGRILPNAFRPVENPLGSGLYPVTFRMIGEGAGFRNTFGYFWTDEDPTNPANLHMVFDCRGGASCACPCNPTSMRSSDGSATSWQRTFNFNTLPGFAPGRAIAFWIRTPEHLDGTRADEQCGGPSAANQNHRTYFTSQALNDDGDFVHFLIYESATYTNTYYFGFEDLFRGGDNDFEDVLARVTGLVPICTPQPESCNGLDDDCDGAIDEGVTTACSTACGTGVRTCSAGSFGACSAPAPTTETCNGRDDDCDASTDEGLSRACSNSCGSGSEICVAGSFVDCTAPTPTIEVCNGRDDDCDGSTDEGLSRACFSACGAGTETCVAANYTGCDAPTPSVEICNGVDDDCDGTTDEGLSRPCSTACGAGTETCVSGTYVGCSAPRPGLEVCNGVDDDCDGAIDEGLTRTCGSACGTGTETCVAGVFTGCDAPSPGAETCNNIDDDCDGVIDDGNPGGGAMCLPNADGTYRVLPDGTPPGVGDHCVPGRVRCVGGELTCAGASSPTREICNCMDDDCDGLVDEDGGGGICPGGACLDCTCASPCVDTEFPCPPGKECDRSFADATTGIIGLCVPGRCAGVSCSEQEVCEPTTGTCRNLCETVSCGGGFACIRGACVEDNCYGRGCDAGQRCRAGVCETDPCVDVHCDADSFCRDGACVRACAAGCPAGESCVDGACAASACGGCATGESCVGGSCQTNACDPLCGRGRVCAGGACVDDPCGGVHCPLETSCVRGECVGTGMPEATEPRLGLATGGGGCSAGGAGSNIPAWLGLLALGLLFWRRRQSPVGVRRAALAPLALLGLIGVLPLLGGCQVDPFCFEGCADAGVNVGRDAAADASADAHTPDGHVDGCVPSGSESCNGLDDDCNGVIDDGFDLMRDPGHCGSCDTACVLPGAFPTCDSGSCAISECEIGFHDLDGNPTNGCEYACLESGTEICDEVDNDCDGAIDEDFGLAADPAHCGACSTVCAYANAAPICSAGVCGMGACRPGFLNVDGDATNGCEYACTAAGAETCNGIDDDCDGAIDEDFNLSTDASNCGACGRRCSFAHAAASCVAGECRPGTCAAGFYDVDGLASDGCEYACTPTGSEVCNGVDDDCDGAIDEDDPSLGTACGSATGACRRGTFTCQLGSLVCAGARGATPETCNGIDDDCDGVVDESTVAAPIPGVGVRCGATNVGACVFGGVVCTGGALVCGGAYRGPTMETCNGIDDDCDGTVDDSPTPPVGTPASCADTRGVCAGRTPVCTGASGFRCSLPATYQTTETLCDGMNNDCDGATDEGCLSLRTATDLRVDTGDAAGAENSVQPVIEGNGSTRAYAAWMDQRGSGGAHIFYARYDDATDAFAAPLQLDVTNGPAIGPRLAVSSTSILTGVWADFRGGTNYREVYSTRSTNTGASFGANTRLNPGQNIDSFNIELATSGSYVYVVYEVFTSVRNRHIYLTRSSDSGATFSAPVRIDHGNDVTVPGYVAATPVVAASGSRVYVVWRDNRNGGLDIYLSRSVNNGATFGATDKRVDVGDAAGASSGFAPSVAAEADNVYVAWVDDRSGASFDVYFNRSTDAGATFLASAVDVDDDSLAHDTVEPTVLAPSPGAVVVGFVDYRFGFPDVFARRSVDAGLSFGAAARLDTGTAEGASGSYELRLAAEGALIGAVFSDDRSGMLDIYANYSLDGGANWQPNDVRLDSTGIPGSSDSVEPDVAVSGGAVRAVWVDHRSGANGDIYGRVLR